MQVAEAEDEAEAEVIRELLEAQGITAFYWGEGELGSPDPAADQAPRGIFVDAADADAARRAIADAQAAGG